MIEKEKPAVIDAADKLNDVIEDLALKAAGTKGDGDPVVTFMALKRVLLIHKCPRLLNWPVPMPCEHQSAPS